MANHSTNRTIVEMVLLVAGMVVLAPRHSRSSSDDIAARVTNGLRPMQGAERRQQTMNPYASNLRIISRRADIDFMPNGNLKKPVWRRAEWVRLDRSMSGHKRYRQSETRVAAVWTPAAVYFAYRCKYTVLNLYKGENPTTEKWRLWDRDVVEVFINPRPEFVNHYYEFEVAPNNLWIDLEIDNDRTPIHDANWSSHFEHATHIDSRHRLWTCEMRIPVAPVGVRRIFAGSTWRLNLFRADGLGDDTQRRFLAWSPIPQGASFHVPTRFGIIEFAR